MVTSGHAAVTFLYLILMPHGPPVIMEEALTVITLDGSPADTSAIIFLVLSGNFSVAGHGCNRYPSLGHPSTNCSDGNVISDGSDKKVTTAATG